VATPANVADSTVLRDLLHGNETRVWGDQAYRGQRAKLRYRGLKKHAHGLIVTCALANLYMARQHLLQCQGA
jgi:hypothetical protein